MSAEYITYFGYGSLVNRDTCPVSEVALPARLYGWQRVWGHRVLSDGQSCDEVHSSCCALTVQKVAGAESLDRASQPYIDGVVVTISADELVALDLREEGYDRLLVSRDNFDLPADCKSREVQVYISKATHKGVANEQYPILQSYVDCVLAGYNSLFKDEGMQHFIDSTIGWEGEILNEREQPKYPRAVNITKDQESLFDQLVRARIDKIQQA